MPLKFWDEAFLNRLPSRVINNEPPFFHIYGKHPAYSFLKTFGCACWPHMRPYNTRKLEFRSKKCVFFGYSHKHKGCKCLDPSVGHIYISRDVIFDEYAFPFASINPNVSAQLRAELALLPDLFDSSRDSFSPNHDADSSVPSNTSQGSARDCVFTGENSGEKHEESEARAMKNRGHFMCLPPGSSADGEADPLTTSVSPAVASSLGTGELLSPAPGGGSFVAADESGASPSPHAAAQPDHRGESLAARAARICCAA